MSWALLFDDFSTSCRRLDDEFDDSLDDRLDSELDDELDDEHAWQ